MATSFRREDVSIRIVNKKFATIVLISTYPFVSSSLHRVKLLQDFVMPHTTHMIAHRHIQRSVRDYIG